MLLAFGVSAATAEPTRKAWPAQWIAAPDTPPRETGVFHFRKTLDLPAKPPRFVVHVSADNRYILFVNGTQVSRGPARGDLMHWRYETVDLAPYLHAGNNVIAATVWNWGEYIPGAQISRRTGFLLQSDDPSNAAINSGPSWKVAIDKAYGFTRVTGQDAGSYYAAAPGETVDARLLPWGWERQGFDDRGWPAAIAITGRATPRGSNPYGEADDWQLVPRTIPASEERPVRFAEVRRAENVKVPGGFLSGRGPFTIPANSKVSILLDQRELTMGYPVLVASGGRDAKATLTFAESLFDAAGHKNNRDEIAGKAIRGLRDRIIFDGGNRQFQSLWLRTWRYVQLDIETAAEPLRIDDVHSIFTAYPFKQAAAFSSDRPDLSRIWDIDWRVFRLSAFETFWDTPYYEQFQYVGDSRIESLISLYSTGDDRLMRNTIEQFDQSRVSDGLTASRYPSSLPQHIAPFSLWWIAMIHDHWLYRGDADYSRQFLHGIRGVIGWYEKHIDDNGQLGPMPWWNFLDWSRSFDHGVAPGADDGHSTAITLQYAYVLKLASDLERSVGSPAEADRDLALADRLNAAARAQSWDESRGLFADTPEKRSFSQHTNILAILSGAVPPAERPAVMRHILADKDLAQASYYFRFYLNEALFQSGLGDQYVEQLEPWREMLRLGLTTTLEEPEPSRSDSHAWSAHPNYHLLTAVLGIRPGEPGFRSVRIAPVLGELKRASGRVPTPQGTIDARFQRRGADGLTGTVILPPGVSGFLVWNGRSTVLQPGTNQLRR